MKLDPLQAAWFGGGILLALMFHAAIVVVLLRQRNQPLLQLLPAVAAGGNSLRGRDRLTGVADFGSDSSLLDGAASSLQREWQSAEAEHRLQEASIIEEVVTRNVNMARELSHC